MLEVFAAWCDFWIAYWTLTYGIITATSMGVIILLTVFCLLGKIWGSSGTSGILLELKKIRKQIEETNRILREREEEANEG